MKANIPQNRPIILGYNLTEKSREGLAKLCWEDGILLREIKAPQLGVKLLNLAVGTAQEAAYDKEVPAREAMIFCFTERKVLYFFLDQMKEAGVSVELKAVMTPTSQEWVLGDLLRELEEEHLEMAKRNNG